MNATLFDVLGYVESALSLLTFLYVAYNVVMAIPGLLLRPPGPPTLEAKETETVRFLVLVAAHDEEAVIGETVRCLKALDYPPERVRVAVVCDNCSDRTADIARAAGAEAWVRTDPVRRGKGHAVRWALARAATLDDWQAVVLLDADNLVDRHLLRAFAARLERGEEAIQAYLDSKNPTDNWLSLSYAMGYWGASRLYQFARDSLGLSAQLGGTGFCLARTIVEELGWPALSLTEDLELTMRLILSGRRVTWAHEARVYDEKPVRLAVAWRQRVRWMQGHTFVSRRLTVALLGRALRTGDLAALDGVMYLWAPTLQLVGTVWTLSWLAVAVFGAPLPVPVLPLPGFMVMVVGLYGATVVGLVVERRAWALRNLPGYLFAGSLWWATAVVGWLRHRDQGTWVHTPHSRALRAPVLGPETAVGREAVGRERGAGA
jgi:cellulose synthase/poly-beta-1,6-N-acetylglucosamine synthase-like glycosyltransferase